MYFYLIIGALFYLFYVGVIKKKYSYWSSKNVKGPEPIPIVGNFFKVMTVRETLEQFTKRIYEAYPTQKVVGVYQALSPSLVIRDPEMIKQVLIKDFNNFQDRGVKLLSGNLGENLFLSEGETWRILRQNLTPVFTSGKLKHMAPLMQNCIDLYIKHIHNLIDNNAEEEIRSLQSKMTLEVIGSCAFGLDLQTFSNESNEFVKTAQKLLVRGPVIRILAALNMIIPGIRQILSFIPDNTTEYEGFFVNIVESIINQRGGKPSKRKDFMDFMIELKTQGKISRREERGIAEIEVNEGMMAAQAFIFYFAGFETSAGTTSYLLYELALHPDIQERLYQEVTELYKKYNGELNYESLSELSYLEMVFDETLRKYPVVSPLFRKCLSDYTFPGTNLSIKKGTSILIPVSGLHYDPQYFPNPNNFDPERFSPENRSSIPSCVYLPFGDGPRNCIGMRFAKVQSLFSVAAFVKNFKVLPTEKTQKPLTFSPKGLTLTSKTGIWLKILKRTE